MKHELGDGRPREREKMEPKFLKLKVSTSLVYLKITKLALAVIQL